MMTLLTIVLYLPSLQKSLTGSVIISVSCRCCQLLSLSWQQQTDFTRVEILGDLTLVSRGDGEGGFQEGGHGEEDVK